MPYYSYVAKSREGKKESGTFEAKNEVDLARKLHKEGYILISAKAIGGKKGGLSLPLLGVSLTEKMMFIRNLRVMIGAGVSLPRALKISSQVAENKKFKQILLNIERKVVKGENLSDALAVYPDVFPELFVNIVKVGESSGTLEKSLKIIEEQMEREHEIRSKLISAMIYPAVIILAMLGVGFLMLIKVVPQLAKTFAELNIELPPTTQLVIEIGTFLAHFWYLFFFLIFIFPFLFKRLLKTKEGKRIFDRLTLKMPVISSLIVKTNSASMMRTLSSLISAGVPLVRSLKIISGSLGNIYYRESLEESAERVKRGEKLSQALRRYDIYPLMVNQMLEIGEETGQTADVLKKLALFYEEEVERATKNLTSLIEPVLLLLIGGVVGFFAVSMIQPMYSMLGAIK